MNKNDINLMTEAYSKVFEAGEGQASFPQGQKGDQPMPADQGAANSEPVPQAPQTQKAPAGQSLETILKSILPQLQQIIQQLQVQQPQNNTLDTAQS